VEALVSGATASLTCISKRFRTTVALDDVTFDLEPGITGLLGPNGAGKTTLLRVMATVLDPDRGDMRLLDRSTGTHAERTEIRRRLGYLPQELAFPRGFTAFGFVDYMAILKEWDEKTSRHEEVRRVLEIVELTSVATKKIKTLSGGMRRRLGIAQAILGRPELLLLDEPTTGLDPEQRANLRRVLSTIGQDATVLLSTHQTGDIEALCDQVIVLGEGRVRFHGTVTELVATAAGSVWLADAPDLDALAYWRTGSGRFRHVGRAASGCELVEPSLEDAYLLMRGGGNQAKEMEAHP
jgi:ABC-2 type transport system ATP-binding protein